MVVRHTEKRDFGLATGWSEDDGTTTTYQPFARSVGGHRRIETGPVPRNVQQRMDAPASMYARRPSGVQPKVATPLLDEYEVLELDELDPRGNPFAPRHSAASVSVWNVLGFCALFASVLIGRVIVDAGQRHARTAAEHVRAPDAPQPSAAAASGSAGVGAEAQRNAAALDPELAPSAVSAGSAQPASDIAKSATPNLGAESGAVDSATEAANAKPAGLAKPDHRRDNSAKAALSGVPGSSVKPEPPGSDRRGATGSQPTAAEASSRGSHARAAASDWRDEPMEPATTNDRTPSNWRDGPMEPATSSFAAPSATAAPVGRAALGTLRINSRPWSQVFIDGRLIGNTPQMAVSVPAGRYTVRLSNPELGMSKTIVVQVAAGELVTRVESLE